MYVVAIVRTRTYGLHCSNPYLPHSCALLAVAGRGANCGHCHTLLRKCFFSDVRAVDTAESFVRRGAASTGNNEFFYMLVQ